MDTVDIKNLEMAKMENKVKKLIDSEVSSYKIGKETGISQSYFNRLRNGERDIKEISFKKMLALYQYQLNIDIPKTYIDETTEELKEQMEIAEQIISNVNDKEKKILDEYKSLNLKVAKKLNELIKILDYPEDENKQLLVDMLNTLIEINEERP